MKNKALTSNSVKSAIIFVHGIFSSCETFDKLINSIKIDFSKRELSLSCFNYDYNLPMPENGDLLANFIHTNYKEYNHITIISHSMGGIISRLALLRNGKKMKNVKRLFMLGTPNFGSLTLRQLGILAQLTWLTLEKISGVFWRKRGIFDLTRTREVIEKELENENKIKNCWNVEYITIPGMFFNEKKSDFRLPKKRLAKGFTLLNVTTQLSSLLPLWDIVITKPHDGIVEERNVHLLPNEDPTRKSEKTPVFQKKVKPPSYGHITCPTCNDLTHVDIHDNDNIIEIIKNIIRNDGIWEWEKRLPRYSLITVQPQ